MLLHFLDFLVGLVATLADLKGVEHELDDFRLDF